VINIKVKIEWVKLPRKIPENMGLEEFETDHLTVKIERADGSTEDFHIREDSTTHDTMY